MRTPIGVFIFIAIILLFELYVFQAVKSVTIDATSRTKLIVFSIYWTITLFMVAGYLIFSFTNHEFLPKNVRTYLFAIIVGLFLAKLTSIFFILIDDIRRAVQWLAIKIIQRSGNEAITTGDGITRSVFLSWFALAAGSTVFGTLLYGFGNKYNYHLKRTTLAFDNLPAGFKGLKIIQISDIHSGSFTDPEAVLHGVQKILAEKPDLILFTGDLVNNEAAEMKEYIPIFSLLKAPMGVYSTLGNHDYGDYINWPKDGLTKVQNLEELKKTHATLGWRLLMNEHVALERGGDKIALIGVENWGAKARFPKLGRLDLAHQGTEEYPFKILMSHDPSHWEAQVLPKYADIDLTLSGHTHGMQFGVEIPGFKWSPVQYMYKQWAGLYENNSNKQKLYVNRGFGFIGYPGRVGILPEITVIELA
jgi:predicted MPP superfamily phosphohydrolase